MVVLRNKNEAQPWAAYQLRESISYRGNFCHITTSDSLLPFQLISASNFISAEITPYGIETWTPITITITDITLSVFHIISYDGSAIDELDPGIYEFRINAGETWYFEPINVTSCEFCTNDFHRKSEIMTILRFEEYEHWPEGAIISSDDSFLPFMYRTDHISTDPKVYLLDCECNEMELTGFPLTVQVIDNKTYYIYDGTAYNFSENSCGIYRLKISDGEYNYYSVPFKICSLAEEEISYFLTADNTIITADDTIITVDEIN